MHQRINSSNGIQLTSNIEGGNAHHIEKVSEHHFRIKMVPDIPSVYKYPDHHCYWFYFKMTGALGKKVKIDITNCD